ncbi:acetolactate synthase small subunit [Candidatus Woesearchaeota archaeon]|nr:acetolactate synthase small subunit [Candidatus Woesearchaeota archaeon]
MSEKKHIISMLVEDEPGVMTRISGMFARRGFNIDTITVGKTNKPGISKIVVTLIGDDSTLEQVEKQINKLVDVTKVSEMGSGIIRELCLIKIKTPNKKVKDELFDYAKVYKAKFVDVDHRSMTLEIIGVPEKIESFIEMVKAHGIIDISRTGVTAMSRGIINN